MVDLYLQAMMRGEITRPQIEKTTTPKNGSDKPTAKTPLDLAIEKEVEAYLDSQNFDEGDPRANMLSSPAMKRARMKAELNENLKMNEYNQQLGMALQLIKTEGKQYLEENVYDSMVDGLDKAETFLDQIDPNIERTEDFQEILHISDETMQAIATIAIAKFEEAQYADCLAIFTMLALLKPVNPDYWFRAGIAAQYLKQEDLAIKNYSIATEVDPQLIGAYLFAAECYHQKGMRDEAIAQRNSAKEKMADLPDPTPWKGLMASVSTIIEG